jgi:ParB family chromosome partitioning protein
MAMPTPELLSLLALCVGLTVNAMALREDETPASAIAQAVDLDMHDWWTPTAEGYFDHVSKARALEAVRVFAPDQVDRLAKLKKAEISREAERLSAGSAWLPALLDQPLMPAAIEAEPDGATVADTGDGENDKVGH